MPPAHLRTFVPLLCLLVIACGGVSSAPEDGVVVAPVERDTTPEALPSVDGARPNNPTPTGGPSSPSPSAPADLTRARLLEAEGELRSALNAYLAVANSNSNSRGEAVLGAARVLLDLDRAMEARSLLEPFLAAGAGPHQGAARYLLGRTYDFLSMPQQALEQFLLYADLGGPATAYARIERARILAGLGQAEAAEAEAQAAVALGIPAAVRNGMRLSMAQAYERAGQPANALGWFQALLDGGGDPIAALTGLSRVKRAIGDLSYWQDEARLMASYPSSAAALAALNRALEAGVAVDSFVRGLVLYRHGEYDRAFDVLMARINAAPNDPANAEAYYYVAAIQEHRNQAEQALISYARVVELNPSSTLADDALWWRGRILEDAGRRSEAAAVFGQLAVNYPSSSWASDAALRGGLLLYQAGDYRGAANAWAQMLLTATGLVERQRLTLWQGKALLKAGETAQARTILEQLAASGEDDYYGIRAVALLNGRHGLPKATVEANINLTPDFDWAAAEAWLSQRTGRTVTPAHEQPWAADSRWARAQELWTVGRAVQAEVEALSLLDSYNQDPIALYTMARALAAQGRTSISGRAGQRLLRVLNTKPNQGLPKAILSLSYPAAFPTAVQRYAQAEGISPLLMLAFIRQESFFDPRAVSPAGALGLTQVLPATGRTLASRLGVTGFESDQLLQADTNIRFGAHYMANALRELDGNIYAALAAYNAGQAAARRWLPAAHGDADLYVEVVEWAETRLYLEIVAENYAIYRYLYAGEPVPNLPRD